MINKVLNKKLYKSTIGIDNNEVIIGNELDDSSFVPKIKFTKWDKENYLSISPIDTILAIESLKDDKSLEIGDNKIGLYFKQHDIDTFKFGLILKEKPLKNSWSFQLEGWEELDFFYQPALTQAEIDEGCVRPDEVVGSYAVYHKTKKNYEVGKTNYQNGKFCHIFRPKFIDANNNWAWADLHIENGIYTVTVPQKFLDEAVYPIIANDTFGYGTPGQSTVAVNTNYANGSFFNAGAGGTGISISAYVRDSTTCNFKACVWQNDIDLGYPLEDNGVGGIATATDVAGWKTSTFAVQPTGLSQGEGLGIVVESIMSWFYFDAGDANQGFRDSSNSYTTPQDLDTNVTYTTNKYSIYCTFTAGGGGTGTALTLGWMSCNTKFWGN